MEDYIKTIALNSQDAPRLSARIPIVKNVIAFDWIISVVCIVGAILASICDFLMNGKKIYATISKKSKGIRFARNWGGGCSISLKGIVISYWIFTPAFALLIFTDVGYLNPIPLYRNDISFMASIVYFYLWLPMPVATLALTLTYFHDSGKL